MTTCRALRRCRLAITACFAASPQAECRRRRTRPARSATNVVTSVAGASGLSAGGTRIKSVLDPSGRSTTAVRGSFLSWLLAGKYDRLAIEPDGDARPACRARAGPSAPTGETTGTARIGGVLAGRRRPGATGRPGPRRWHSLAATRARGPGRRRPVPRRSSLRCRVDARRAARFVNRADHLVLPDDADRLLERGQIGEQVDELLVGHRLGQALGHERDVAGPALLDRAGRDRDPLARRRS